MESSAPESAAHHATAESHASPEPTNGAAMAALLGAGIGTFAVGFFVVIHIMGIYDAPAIYGPSGGASGRTAFGVIVWLIAWGVLHWRWKDRELQPKRVITWTFVLLGLGILATFPPFWTLLE